MNAATRSRHVPTALNVAGLVEPADELVPERTAFETNGGRGETYRELDEQANSLEGRLSQHPRGILHRPIVTAAGIISSPAADPRSVRSAHPGATPAVMPPSITNSAPVEYEDSSLIRNTTNVDTSAVLAERPSGILTIPSGMLSVMGVRMRPG